MKKIIALAFAGAAVLSMSAQQDCKSMFEQAKKLDDLFNKEKPTQTDPNKVISVEAAQALIDAYTIYNQVIECEAVPNAKGKVENKLTKKAEASLLKHAQDGDYYKAAMTFYNAEKNYPEASKAFFLSGLNSQKYATAPDTIAAEDFFNAGTLAFGNDFNEAAAAFEASRKAGSNKPEVYLYNIYSLQQLAMKDTTLNFHEQIFDIAKQGVGKFGATNDQLYKMYIQHFLDNDDLQGAFDEVNKAMAKEPNSATLYGLRGYLNVEKNEVEPAIADYSKAGELSDNFEYVRDYANTINRLGKFIIGQLPMSPTADQKTMVLGIFQEAKKLAEKAQTLPEADGSVASILDDINYNIENAEKL